MFIVDYNVIHIMGYNVHINNIRKKRPKKNMDAEWWYYRDDCIVGCRYVLFKRPYVHNIRFKMKTLMFVQLIQNVML